MNIIQILKKEHREVAALFRQIGKTTEKSVKVRSELLSKLEINLGAHAVAEEAVLYTALRGEKKTREDVFEADEEHGVAKRFLAELLELSPSDERWTGKMTVLNEMIDHHVEEEEEDLFKKTASLFDEDELEAMGEKYAAHRDRWIREHRKELAPKAIVRRGKPAILSQAKANAKAAPSASADA